MKARYKAALVLIATFVLGGIVGAFSMRAFAHQRFGRHFRGPPHEARERFRVEAMSRRLDLTSEQRSRIESVLASHRDERRRIFEKCRPEHEALRGKVEGEIREVLSAEQRQRYDEIRERRAKRRKRRGPPGP